MLLFKFVNWYCDWCSFIWLMLMHLVEGRLDFLIVEEMKMMFVNDVF